MFMNEVTWAIVYAANLTDLNDYVRIIHLFAPLFVTTISMQSDDFQY
jgi:hypothetical protein